MSDVATTNTVQDAQQLGASLLAELKAAVKPRGDATAAEAPSDAEYQEFVASVTKAKDNAIREIDAIVAEALATHARLTQSDKEQRLKELKSHALAS